MEMNWGFLTLWTFAFVNYRLAVLYQKDAVMRNFNIAFAIINVINSLRVLGAF